MTYTPQLSQADLAEMIDREGLEFEIYVNNKIDKSLHKWFAPIPNGVYPNTAAEWVRYYEIRPAPGALNEWGLPRGMEPHNPDNLTPEQITEGGYRAVTFEELDFRHKGLCEAWVPYEGKFKGPASGYQSGYTYRVPITTPLPPVKESLTPQPAPDVEQSATPRSRGIFLALDVTWKTGTSYEHFVCAKEAAKIGIEDLETELTDALAQRDEARRLLGEAMELLKDALIYCPMEDEKEIEETITQITNHLKTA